MTDILIIEDNAELASLLGDSLRDTWGDTWGRYDFDNISHPAVPLS